MINLTTPISHLFKDITVAETILASSDNLECRDHSISFNEEKQVAFHCELQPIHPMGEKDFTYLKHIWDKKKNLQLFSFHVASCCDEAVIIDNMFQPAGTTFSRNDMLQQAAVNFKRIKRLLGNNIMIAVENNNYYPTEAYQVIADPEFIRQLVEDNDLYFLFDIAHARVSSHNKGISYERYTDGLPMDRTIQLHICGHGVHEEKNLAYDAHFAPAEKDYAEVARLISKYDIRYLTLEYYKDSDILLDSLNRLRKVIQ